jgi:hypothetical protein
MNLPSLEEQHSPSSSEPRELTATFKSVRFSDTAIRYNDSAIGRLHHCNGAAGTCRWNSCEVSHRQVRKKEASPPSVPQRKGSMEYRPHINRSSSDHGPLGATNRRRSMEDIPKRKSALDSRSLSSRSLMDDTESSSLKPLADSDVTLRQLTDSDSSLDLDHWSPRTSDSDHTAPCIPKRHMSDSNISTYLLHEMPPKTPDEDASIDSTSHSDGWRNELPPLPF